MRRLPARSPLQTAPFRGGYIIRDSLDPTRPHPKRHLDRFSRFAGLTVLKNISHPRTDKLGHVPVCPFKSASFGGASGSNTSIVVLRFWSSSPAASRPLLEVLVLISGALVYEIVSATSLFNTWCLGPRESTSQRGDCRVDLRDMQIADPRIPLTHFSTF